MKMSTGLSLGDTIIFGANPHQKSFICLIEFIGGRELCIIERKDGILFGSDIIYLTRMILTEKTREWPTRR